MTTKPRLRVGRVLLPGVLAVGLFGLMALIVLNTSFGGSQGFPESIAITSELGYAMFGLDELQSTAGSIPNTESFLAAFFLIAVVLDAALDGAIVLAKREEGGKPVVALPSQRDDAEPARSATGRETVADGGSDSTGSVTATGSDADSAADSRTGGDGNDDNDGDGNTGGDA
ncbi:hypothetical protein [Natrialba aegyptia]|uniref:NADH dehydrogenase-like complex subunit J2 n=1 Tax=Natrialba aegyptia DSM 13077 TaxID=1227491 RepID=M0BE82_9EURY|nr:hypothetical protein [Natrialba aegyptia]ELZ09201.1 hypothetical protein C480_02328 [Natrialba aegyptia DSM 13077]